MLEQFSVGIQTIQTFARSLTGIALIIPALFWLFFADRFGSGMSGGPGSPNSDRSGASRDKRNANRPDTFVMLCTAWLALLPLLVYTAPVSSGLIIRLSGDRPLTACYLAVPTVLVAGYAVTMLAARHQIFTWPRRRRILLHACLAIAVLASVSMPWLFSGKGFALTTNALKIDREIIAISDVIGTEKTLMPAAIRSQLGEYEPDSLPADGVRYFKTSAGNIARTGVEADCRYALIAKEYDKPAKFTEFGWGQCAETKNYIIYERNP